MNSFFAIQKETRLKGFIWSFIFIFTAIVFAVLFYRSGGVVGFSHDSRGYLIEANAILGSYHPDSIRTGLYFRGPVYPYYLAFSKMISGESYLYFLMYLNALIVALIGYIFWHSMRRVIGGTRAACFALLIISNPELLSVFTYLSSETLFLPLFVYLVSRFFVEKGFSRFDIMLIPILAAIRENGVIIYPGLVLFYILSKREKDVWKSKLPSIFLSILMSLFFLLQKGVPYKRLARSVDVSQGNLLNSIWETLNNPNYGICAILVVLVILNFKHKYMTRLLVSLTAILVVYTVIIIGGNIWIDKLITFKSRLILPFFIIFVFLASVVRFEDKRSNNILKTVIAMMIVVNMALLIRWEGIYKVYSKQDYINLLPSTVSAEIYTLPNSTNNQFIMNIISDKISYSNIVSMKNDIKETKKLVRKFVREMKRMNLDKAYYFEFISPIDSTVEFVDFTNQLEEKFEGIEIKLIANSITSRVYELNLKN